MKKQDPFSGIPAVPNSLAGQWLAFNHMANHYRKLLNVKPRVDSLAPRIASNPNIIQSIQSQLTSKVIQSGSSGINAKPKKVVKKPIGTTTKKGTTNHKIVTCQYQPYSDSLLESPQSSSRTVVKKRPLRKSIGKDNIYDVDSIGIGVDYQVVFGPSSLKSSTDALVSDCDSQPDEPRVETIGVAEKIKVFLEHLHDHNNNLKKKVPSPSFAPNSRTALVQSKQSINSKGPFKTNTVLESRPSRHSKCFLPHDSNENSPKKVTKKKPLIHTSGINPQGIRLSDAINKAKMIKANVNTTAKSITATNIQRRVGKESRGKNMMKADNMRYLSGGSGGSVGTIRGSDELLAEDELLVVTLPPKKVPMSQESPNSIKHFTNSSKQRNKSGILRSLSTGYCSQSLSGKATSLSSLGLINNKDSSRDSAYGFSSGESRITTRESTPEKTHASAFRKSKSRKSLDRNNNTKNYESTLSTVASSVNLETIPANAVGQMQKEKRDLSILDPTGDKYLNFLTDITEDIVNRGIYTNKGLKVLFKVHLENHKGLDPHKMEEMLDKLRMDLGIPKDDTLNKLEFGYGSVLYTTDSYFYKKENPSIPEKVHPSSSKGRNMTRKNERSRFDHGNGSNGSNSSLENGPGGSESSKSGESISETELRLTLKEVGLDSETALEIVQIINHHDKTMNSDDSDLSPTRLTKPARSKNFPESHGVDVHRRRQSVRSDSPPSRCSTGSS